MGMQKLVGMLGAVIAIFLPVSLGAQITFDRTYDGPGAEWSYHAEQISDGGYIVVGKTNSFGAGGNDVWLIKTDNLGDTLWTRTYGGAQEDYGLCVRQTHDGGYIITANTMSYGAGSFDGWIIKTDVAGYVEWDTTFGFYGPDYASHVIQTSDNNYVIVGQSEYNTYLAKLNAAGHFIWSRSFWPDTSSYGYGVDQTSDGGYIVTGNFQIVPLGSHYPLLLKTDAAGNQEWLRVYSESAGWGNSVTQTSDGGYFFAGEWNGAGSVMKTNVTGDSIWAYTFPYDGAGCAVRSCVEASDGGYVVGGDLYQGDIAKFNASGDTLWKRYFPGILASSVEQTADGGFIIAGSDGVAAYKYVRLIKTDALGYVGVEEERGIVPTSIYLSQNYPNPFTHRTSIQYAVDSRQRRDKNLTTDYCLLTTLKIFDLSGRLVRTLVDEPQKAGYYNVSWDGKDSSGNVVGTGIYFYQLKTSGGFKEVRKMLLLK
jgi:hypothetical protein